MNSLLSPEPQDRRTRRRVSHPPPDDEDIVITGSNDDDVIIMSPSGGIEGSPYSSSVREFPLKVRCRTDVHKISVLSVRHLPLVIPLPRRPHCDVIRVLLVCFQSTPLRDVVTQLSVILDVPRPRLLLMREEVELPTDSTVGEHGLGIADIIGESRDLSSKHTELRQHEEQQDVSSALNNRILYVVAECVVMAAEGGAVAGSITVKLQSKDRDSSHEFSLNKVCSSASPSSFSSWSSFSRQPPNILFVCLCSGCTAGLCLLSVPVPGVPQCQESRHLPL